MATRVETPYTRRARYYSSGDAFNIAHSRIPAHVFLAERDRALDPGTPTGLIPLDLGAALGIAFPATTPLILARYARIRAGEELHTRLAATGELYFAIEGEGETRRGDERIAWEAGDIVCLPGGAPTVHVAGSPPAEVHSHHNAGGDRAMFLIVQDGGLHYHTRTMGFSYA